MWLHLHVTVSKAEVTVTGIETIALPYAVLKATLTFAHTTNCSGFSTPVGQVGYAGYCFYDNLGFNNNCEI